MSAAEERARSRSRSPAKEAGAADAPTAGVPAHWLKPVGGAAPASDSKVSAAPSAGKGKGKAAGKRAALLIGSVGEDALDNDEPVTASTLLALASELEDGKSPEDLAKTIKRAATRMATLEKAVGELGQALRTVSSLSAQTLAATGLLSGNAADPVMMDATMEGAGQSEGTKSYLLKKGDEDVQEAHRRAAEIRPSISTNHGPSGGALSAAPKTKDEMDAARRARLEHLEAQQADKVKEREAADAKSKAREAMFEKPFMGSAKPLGKM